EDLLVVVERELPLDELRQRVQLPERRDEQQHERRQVDHEHPAERRPEREAEPGAIVPVEPGGDPGRTVGRRARARAARVGWGGRGGGGGGPAGGAAAGGGGGGVPPAPPPPAVAPITAASRP